MTEALIGIGSNTDDATQRVAEACRWLKETFDNVNVSDVYRTESISGDGSLYANAVARIHTDMDADQLNHRLKAYELQCGRQRIAGRKMPVVIDLDVVCFGGEILRPRDYSFSFFQIGLKQL